MGSYRQRSHRWFYRLMGTTLVLMLLSACVSPNKGNAPPSAQITPPPQPTKLTGHVVDIKKNLPVRVDTSLKAKQMGQLMLGDSVYINEEKINDEKEEWYRVASVSEKGGQPLEGWVLQRYIEKDIVVPSPEVPAPSESTSSTEQAGTSQEKNKDLSGMKLLTTLQGTVFGAALGGGLGALTALISGKNVATGAAIGAAAGGVAGLVAGVYVANQKEKYATEEAYLDACMKEAAQYNEEARQTNEYLRGYIAETEGRVQELKAQISKDRTKKTLVQKDLTVLNQKRQAVDKMISNLEGEVIAQNGALGKVSKSSPQSVALKQDVQTTQQELDQLRKQREQLLNLTMKMNDLTV
ncbi:MAG: hypothetical protein PHS86_00885 [Syntrophaceae bacterium]|nr:hypothetical protein [Syntrophaceae bacterium]